MDSVTAADIVENQLHVCKDVLVGKAREYATDDALHNFRVAAALEATTMRQALAGMMVKHTVSVYDLCKQLETAPLDKWTEKITDHINYLLLLKVVVMEEADEQAKEEWYQETLTWEGDD